MESLGGKAQILHGNMFIALTAKWHLPHFHLTAAPFCYVSITGQL